MEKQHLSNEQVGVWIDHKEAFAIVNDEANQTIEHIVSNMEKHTHYSGHAIAGEGLAEDHRDRQFATHLNLYYDDVISHIKNATSIYIFGPGEAKTELKKRFERISTNGKVVGFETAEKLTMPQMVDKVHAFFRKQN